MGQTHRPVVEDIDQDPGHIPFQGQDPDLDLDRTHEADLSHDLSRVLTRVLTRDLDHDHTPDHTPDLGPTHVTGMIDTTIKEARVAAQVRSQQREVRMVAR